MFLSVRSANALKIQTGKLNTGVMIQMVWVLGLGLKNLTLARNDRLAE